MAILHALFSVLIVGNLKALPEGYEPLDNWREIAYKALYENSSSTY